MCHFCFFCLESGHFSPLAQSFLVWFLLQCGQRTRRCIISCVRGSWDVRGASYGRGKPQKLALFRGVPISKKVEEALARLSLCAEHFCLRHSLAPSDIQLVHETYFFFVCERNKQTPKSCVAPGRHVSTSRRGTLYIYIGVCGIHLQSLLTKTDRP